MSDLDSYFDESRDEPESVDPEDFEAGPEEDEAEERATAAWEAEQRREDYPFDLTAPQQGPHFPTVKSESPQISHPKTEAPQATRRIDQLLVGYEPEHDPRVLIPVQRELQLSGKKAKGYQARCRKAVDDQQKLIRRMKEELEDAQEELTRLMLVLRNADKHRNAARANDKAVGAHTIKTNVVNLKQHTRRVRYAHVPDECDGVRFNHTKCTRQVNNSHGVYYCAEHQSQGY